jgi:hypothetical protein
MRSSSLYPAKIEVDTEVEAEAEAEAESEQWLESGLSAEQQHVQRRRDKLIATSVDGVVAYGVVEAPWSMPSGWLEEKLGPAGEFRDYVGFDVWSKYDGMDAGFEATDDIVWDEDVYSLQTFKHLDAVTDLYLRDHRDAILESDARKEFERKTGKMLMQKSEKHATQDNANGKESDSVSCNVNAQNLPLNGMNAMNTKFERNTDRKLRGLGVTARSSTSDGLDLEPIPSHLTPDKDRGIDYSDDIIEMKGKISLHPVYPDPAIEYENDTFTHNTEQGVLNTIGTIREQYDWLPPVPDTRTLVVEEHKRVLLKPVLDFANHLVVLKSTKVCCSVR